MKAEFSTRIAVVGCLLGGLVGTSGPSAQDRTVLADLRAAGRPLGDSTAAFRALGAATMGARIIGLGEATHGQHEAFDLKRRATMWLIRHHGIRVVAYEASASRARLLDEWIQGGAGDVAAAMPGFGMLIWAVEENAALLRDLRDWNARAPQGDRVRLIGVDAQDGEAVATRLRALLGPMNTGLADRIDSLVAAAPPVTQRMFQGQRAGFDSLVAATERVAGALSRGMADHSQRIELGVRATELRAHLTMYGTPGGRDRAMADLLLAQLGARERAVLWAHNGHVQRSALEYLRSPDLAMGGHLGTALGDAYYAVGFAFGSGGFQANAPDSSGRWGFRRYTHAAPATGSLEETLASAGIGNFFLDLRSVRATSPLKAWLQAPHGHRWWGGYNVPDDADARTRDATQLMQMVPARDFDGLVFQLRTTPATPMDRTRILRPR
ncbi:MAG: erythromycin esterase family protein [Gemmatimonadetes bacterium]|nr:erythromycin esterase family protein [Gemmatimonadota bacterium]